MHRFLNYLRDFHPAGLAVALLFYTWSLTPSLLPRVWYMQALATAVSIAIGYGLGVAGAWIVRWAGASWQPSRKQQRIGWWVLAAVTAVVIPLFAVLGAHWQHISRELVGVESDSRMIYTVVLLLAVLVALLLIQAGRGLAALSNHLTRAGRRYVPQPVARLGGLALVVVVGWLLIDGVGVRAMLAVTERSASVVDQETREGVEQPSEPERSGSPASLQAWDSLGRDGRTFVASGPRAEQITEVTGRAAIEPVRVFAGVTSADTVSEIADGVVAELERTGAFDRSVLFVTTTTGRGWINSAAADSLEYITAGDSAIAGMQYSHLQSPLAFIADRQTPLEAGRVLLEKVYAVWSELPEDERPKLVVMGESLGSYGAQGATASEQDMVSRLDGALLIGTPEFAQPWNRITAERDPGSLQCLPVVDEGKHTRFAAETEDLKLPGEWEQPRIVYWQHGSDPITWWSFDLLLREPDWLAEPLGEDINPAMRWLPFVTFWQVTADMAFSAGVPAGHGHAYGSEAVGILVGILDPPDWDEESTRRVEALLRDPATTLEPLGEFR
ncbi:alpha/beta-hydrolase family protein [Corynebacterium sp. YIM 101645]|uniref:Alpha/beta-hydrolase family protein n=1 Tax=Corynebacterium lemuris TaxID=1859292 RepID=A0ABT2FZV7_9CORY|nr:alpha/beta-hydrolase family protein [Corynebacterium lemuris]MCS5480766.1 alpha/beta-hydrolase family protein [Corynebacterium lemuris]